MHNTLSIAPQTAGEYLSKYNWEIISNKINTAEILEFFKKHPKLVFLQNEVILIYKRHNHYFWHDDNGISEFAQAFYANIGEINEEELYIKIPYQDELDQIFRYDTDSKPNAKNELLITTIYFFYNDKVCNGLTEENSRQTGWNLPRYYFNSSKSWSFLPSSSSAASFKKSS